ncbi:hypothetical protein BpHYR1_053433 [Brachionus plicatilis]|uniref:Uncharacterized protein n=1 Tax=Brachionus plicatilis TaxID=10195 RepID=A0A3M7QIL6_BRAPC|nr:hypothetical protein BpHYR1_053433 [Brachionus plicatilis]
MKKSNKHFTSSQKFALSVQQERIVLDLQAAHRQNYIKKFAENLIILLNIMTIYKDFSIRKIKFIWQSKSKIELHLFNLKIEPPCKVEIKVMLSLSLSSYIPIRMKLKTYIVSSCIKSSGFCLIYLIYLNSIVR